MSSRMNGMLQIARQKLHATGQKSALNQRGTRRMARSLTSLTDSKCLNSPKLVIRLCCSPCASVCAAQSPDVLLNWLICEPMVLTTFDEMLQSLLIPWRPCRPRSS